MGLSPNQSRVTLPAGPAPRGTIPSSSGNWAGPIADVLPPAAAAQLHRRLRPVSLGKASKSQLLEISGSFLWAIVPDGLTLKLIFDPPDGGADTTLAIPFGDGDSITGFWFSQVFAILTSDGSATEDAMLVTLRPDQ